MASFLDLWQKHELLSTEYLSAEAVILLHLNRTAASNRERYIARLGRGKGGTKRRAIAEVDALSCPRTLCHLDVLKGTCYRSGVTLRLFDGLILLRSTSSASLKLLYDLRRLRHRNKYLIMKFI